MSASDYQSFLKNLHVSLQTPEDIISHIVQKVSNSKISKIERIIAGESNEVYDVVTEDNYELIVRIGHGEKSRLFTEAWAIEQVKDKNVPTPTILLLEKIKVGTSTIIICVENKIAGVPLRDLQDLPRKSLKNLTRNAGSILAKIHQVKIQGFGELNEKGKAEYKDLNENMQHEIKYKSVFVDAGKRAGISKEVIEEAFSFLQKYVDQFNNSNNVLLHNDFSPKHILINNEEITGILDFETCRAGDPVQEFARWEYYYKDSFPLEWLIEGYTNKEILKSDFALKKMYYKLYKSLILLYHNDSIGNKTGVEKAKENMFTTLEYFKNL